MKCPKCKKPFDKYVIKLNAMLCPNCRVILVYPGSDEFSKELEKRKLQRRIER